MIYGQCLEATLMKTYCFFCFFLEGSRNDDRSLEKVRDSVEMHKKWYHWKFDEELQYVDTWVLSRLNTWPSVVKFHALVLIMLDRDLSPNILFHLIFTTNCLDTRLGKRFMLPAVHRDSDSSITLWSGNPLVFKFPFVYLTYTCMIKSENTRAVRFFHIIQLEW